MNKTRTDPLSHSLLMLLALTLGCATWHTAHAEAPIRVTYLSPDALEHPFWGQIVSFMQAAAEDLKIELEVVVEASDNRFLNKKEGLKIIRREDPPDYFIVTYFPGVTPDLIKAAQESGVNIFVINNNLSDQDREVVEGSLPREKYSRWIGHMYPDGTQAGFLLADELLKIARAKGNLAPTGSFQTIALLGREPSNVYARDWRDFGMKRRLGSTDDAVLLKSVNCDWFTDVAKQETLKAFAESPNISVIWAASDEMAIGAIQAAEELGKQPGKDMVIGGIDWTAEGLQAIGANKLAVSVGGHFMEGAWALILLHDYHYGIDFADSLGTNILTAMYPLTADNVGRYLKKFGTRDWGQIDFTRYSRKFNPGNKKYDFSLETLLQ